MEELAANRARVLAQAAVLAQCVAHLGVVHIGESGAAEEDYDFEYQYDGLKREYAH